MPQTTRKNGSDPQALPQYDFHVICGFSDVPMTGTAAEIALAILLHRLENIRDVTLSDAPALSHSATEEIEQLKTRYRRNPKALGLLSEIFGSPLQPKIPMTLADLDQTCFPDQLHALTGVTLLDPAQHLSNATKSAPSA